MSETVKKVRNREVGKIIRMEYLKGWGTILDMHQQERFFHQSNWADREYSFEQVEVGDIVSFKPYNSFDGTQYKADNILVRAKQYIARRAKRMNNVE